MEFFKPRDTINFLKYRNECAIASIVLCIASVIAIFIPGPNYGIDFRGGTELELEFGGGVTSASLRTAVTELGYSRPEVIAVEGKQNRFILRIQQVSALPAEQVKTIEADLKSALGSTRVDSMKVSPGGDKITMRLSASVDPSVLQEALAKAGAKTRSVAAFGQQDDHRYEALLVGVADELVRGLQAKLGDRAPRGALRAEWVGPKAGAELRDAALKSVLYSVALIMLYVALRFDLRFAPGGVIALLHDACFVMGCYVLLQKEFTLATIAAILTVIGFSINDTIVIYDRIRENMQRMRNASLAELINISTTQTMSRTIITSGVTLLSIVGFFIWGTPVIKDICFGLAVGFVVGTYSSIYIAAPITEWMDTRWFRRA